MDKEVKRINRIAITHSIEDTLNQYCRAECPYYNYSSTSICSETCPIGLELYEQGKKLGAKKTASNIKWPQEQEETLIRLINRGIQLKDIAPMLDRNAESVYNKVSRLRKKGVLT